MTAVAATAEAAIAHLGEAVRRRPADLPELVEAARAGDGEAFAAIVRQFQRSVFGQVLRMVRRRSLAEDLCQDVFVRLWRHLDTCDEAEALGAWLRRVAVNVVIDHWRKEDARRRKVEAYRAHPVARRVVRPSSRSESRELVATIEAALDRLPPKLRSVLMLRAYEGLSYEQLADVLDISTSAVRSRLFRARQQVSENLKHLNAADHLTRMYQSDDDTSDV